MSLDDGIEPLIASVASRTPVDWDAAARGARDDAERARVAALRGIERIASFSHEQWQRFGTLIDHARTLDGSTLEDWLGKLDADDATDLRWLLARPQIPTPGLRAPRDAPDDDAVAEVDAGWADASTPATGLRLGAYTLEAPIGEGGMGEVWSARRSDGRFEGRVAIKLLRLPLVGRHGRGRFQREGEILARLRHPHIAQLLDAGVTDGGQPFLVLEHVDGVPIDRYCDARGLDLRARIRLFLDVLEAVAHAQANLVLHRDLKPSNILVDPAGRVKLLDFGVAKLLEAESAAAAATEVTQHAGRAFTPEFAAPEQLLGEPVTTATDVYSAGVVLYRLLTAAHPKPIGQGAPLERLRVALESEPRLASLAAGDRERTATPAGGAPSAARRRRRELRGDLDNVLAKALKRSPAERYASAAAFADELRRFLAGEPVLARADTIRYRVGKFVRRHRGPVIGASAAVLALAGVTVVALHERADARRQRDEAREQARRADAFTHVITSLLSQVGPGGRALTPEELLDRAVVEMEASYRDQPAFLVDMLIRISGRYYDLTNSNKELATLEKAEAVARRANDPALVFDVQVNTVETELSLGRLKEATRRIEEARRLLPTLIVKPDLDDYLRAEAKVARANGDFTAAIRYLEEARALLESKRSTSGNSYPGILSELGYSYMLLGATPQAYEVSERIVSLDREQGRSESAPGIAARASFAAVVYNLGEVRRARALYEEFVRERPRAGSELLPGLSHLYADMLSRMGLQQDALRILADAVPRAEESDNWSVIVRVRESQTRVLLRGGQLEEAGRALAATFAALEHDEAAPLRFRVEADRLRAELALARGDLDAALGAARAALARAGYPAQRRGPGLPACVRTLARIQLARHEWTAAAESARAAVEIFERDSIDPSRSADVGEATLLLARAQHEQALTSQARRNLPRAIECLRNGLGAEHELTRQAQAFAAQW